MNNERIRVAQAFSRALRQLSKVGSIETRSACARVYEEDNNWFLLSMMTLWEDVFMNTTKLSPGAVVHPVLRADGYCFVSGDGRTIHGAGQPSKLMRLFVEILREKDGMNYILLWHGLETDSCCRRNNGIPLTLDLIDLGLGEIRYLETTDLSKIQRGELLKLFHDACVESFREGANAVVIPVIGCIVVGRNPEDIVSRVWAIERAALADRLGCHPMPKEWLGILNSENET